MHARTIAGIIAGFIAAALGIAAILPARGGGGPDDPVIARIAAMTTGQAALDRLGRMSGGRLFFDRRQAQAARRDLIDLADAIPDLFRDPGPEPGSRALPAVWTRAEGFRDQTQAAERAARALNTRSLNRLRQGLPAVLDSCHGCHRAYRRPP
jgi:cytochrome c556